MRLGAYAKPALLGLVLFTLADKLCTLAGCVSDLLVSDDELERVRGGIRALRDAVAASADVDPRTFIDAVVAGMALTLSVFRYGKAPDLARPEYQPISIAPICRALEDPDFPRAAFGRLAIAVALLGRGLNEGQWTLAIGAAPTAPQHRIQEVPEQDRQRSPRTPGHPPRLRQLRHPQTPTVNTWLAAHPRFHMHFTPTYSSWINQLERFFAYVTADLLQRSDHRSVQVLEADIRSWIKDWNTHPKPFIWTKTAEQILTSLARLLERITGAGH